MAIVTSVSSDSSTRNEAVEISTSIISSCPTDHDENNVNDE